MVFDFDVYLIEMLRETSYFEKNKYPNNAKVPYSNNMAEQIGSKNGWPENCSM